MFVAFANVNRGFYGIFRSDNAHTGAANTRAFTHMPNHTVMNLRERQGEYNLAVAVSPLNPNHVAFGMVELYLNRDRGGAPGRGGLAPSADGRPLPCRARPSLSTITPWCSLRCRRRRLRTVRLPGRSRRGTPMTAASRGAPTGRRGPTFPIGTGTTRGRRDVATSGQRTAWRKRSHGISGAQMYDLTQHPRLPAVMGCGFQDNGVFVGYGGPSWQLVLTADGGFVAFDPDDPYRLIATFQEGVTECRFPGRLRDALPLLRDVIQTGLWPRVRLTTGSTTATPPCSRPKRCSTPPNRVGR